MNRLAVSVLLITALLGGAVAFAAKSVDPQVAKLYGGDEGVAVLQKPDSVEAWRIGPDYIVPKPGADAKNLMHSHPVLSGPVKVDAATSAKLGTLFRDAKSYDFEVAKGCEFRPGVLVRFTQGKNQIDVLICFGCREVAIYHGDKKVGHEDIDAIAGQLAGIAKALFPKDDEIQKL